MKTIHEFHVDTALAAADPLATEWAITEAHRAHADPLERELAVLAIQLPYSFQPVEDGDLIAGRVRYPLVSFGPEPAGLGYVCLENDIRRVAAERANHPSVASRAQAILDYWNGRTTTTKTRAAFPPAMVQALPSDNWIGEPGAAFPLYRLAGTVLDYEKLAGLGLPGLQAEIAARLTRATPEEQKFLRSLQQALQLCAEAATRSAAQARACATDCSDTGRARELRAIADVCDAAATRAPQTFHEAIQLAWIYALCAGSWTYGRVDDWLGPFLEADLAAGRITEAHALDLLCSWWRLMHAYTNQYNNRVIVGGRGRKNPAAADRLALLAIAATRRVRLNQPQLTLRFYHGQNPELMVRALDSIGEGTTYPLLYNDDVNIPAVIRAFNVTEAEAENFIPFGCGEYVLAHRSLGTPSGVINLTHCLALALRDGRELATGRQAGPRTGDACSFANFDDLWRAYAAQVEYFTAALADQQKLEYDVTGGEAPFYLLSALHDDCIHRARPLLAGGVKYVGGTLETYGNTNAADSLHALAQVVFRKRKATLNEIIAALDADFGGPAGENIRQQLLAVPKYGNDDEAADAMAQRVHEHICDFTRAQSARVGLDSYLVVIINNWANTALGMRTAASPDGRRAGQPLANANNPAPGADRSGVTAFMNSLVKLDPGRHAGAVQNMKFSPELFRRNRPKLEALMAGYWATGGAQAMVSVVSRADLEAAMREPEQWGHLMVRVGGFSIRFVELPREAQLEILARTCHE